MDLEKRLDVLDKVELLVGRRRPEIIALVGDGLAGGVAIIGDHEDARLPAERRIREHDVEARQAELAQAIVGTDRQPGIHRGVGSRGAAALRDQRFAQLRELLRCRTDVVQQEVHRAQARHPLHDLDASQRIEAQVFTLFTRELRVLRRQPLVRRQQRTRRCRTPDR